MFLLREWFLLRDVFFLYRLLNKSPAISKAFLEVIKIQDTDNVTTLPPNFPGWRAPFHGCLSARSVESSQSFSMSNDDDSTLSAVALAVALVALVTSLGQLLGQYFSTADGYRRCQSSVMGPWAKYTRLSWRWRQFRFETYFTTPQIIFLPDEHDSDSAGSLASSTENPLMISVGKNVPQSVRDLFVLNEDGQKDEEMVCWVSLLQSLYLNRWKLEQECGFYKRSVTPNRCGAFYNSSFG